MASGGEVVLFPKFSRSNFWSEVRAHGATRFGCFSNAIKLLLDAPERENDSENTLVTGLVGELQPAFKHPFERRFGVKLYDSFGMTECEPMTLTYYPETQPDHSCGKACGDFEVAIVDDQDNVLQANHPGEIVCRPKRPGMMMKGYDNNPDETVRRWRNLWWHTQDLGRMDEEGNLFFLGRLKDVIRHRGENVSAVELETLLLCHPAISECAAIGVRSELGDEDIKVFVKRAADSVLDVESFYAYCRENMAKFMIPRFLIYLEEFPYTYNGKIDKKTLRASEHDEIDLLLDVQNRQTGNINTGTQA